MLKQIFYILILIVLSGCDFATPEEYYNEAYELEEQGRFEEAIQILDKAIEKRPDFKPALLNRGADKSILRNYKGAIEDYKQILAYDSDNTLALINIGNNYKRLEDYKNSIYYYNKALNSKGAIKSDSTYIKINLQNQREQESDYFIRQYEIEFERGVSFMYLKKYHLAIQDLKQAIKYNFEAPDAASWIGQAYYHLNDTLKAKKYLKFASKQGLLDAEELLKKLK
ncbi:tetratricopeptide repeat protein [Christiangramia echinicola]|uniref:tetratricopeptide repeat protein n=1 Tax=Christiangramia echinicola TaxID=279359 RepID=UPI000418F748|nr:tetratricopeptide repeat protein [Christiangramia echinicola]